MANEERSRVGAEEKRKSENSLGIQVTLNSNFEIVRLTFSPPLCIWDRLFEG